MKISRSWAAPAMVLSLVLSAPGAALAEPPASHSEGATVELPSEVRSVEAATIASLRANTRATEAISRTRAAIVQRAKIAGLFVSEEDLVPVDLGEGLVVFENGVEMTHYEEISTLGTEGLPLQFDVETAPAPGRADTGLGLGRGPGSVVGYGWLSQAELYMHWADRSETTLFTYKTRDKKIWDANSRSYRDLWGYSKKAVVTPEDGWPSEDIVHSIYLSAWPYSSSKSRITGWYDYEPFASSGSCDTFLSVGVKGISIPLQNCDSYTRWVKTKNGTDYGYGAMGVTYDQGFVVTGGERQAGLAMGVKVLVGQTPYWNDRMSVNMWQLNILGVVSQSKTCTTYAYAGNVYCSS